MVVFGWQSRRPGFARGRARRHPKTKRMLANQTGQVTVADGTPLASEKIRRVLTNDPGIGVARHVDAGYELAEEVAEAKGVRVPMSEGR